MLARLLPAACVTLALLVSTSLPAAPGMPTPTPEQLKLLQQLSPADREALIQRYLGTPGATSSTSSGTSEAPSETVPPREAAETSATTDPQATVDDIARLRASLAEEKAARDLAWCRNERLVATQPRGPQLDALERNRVLREAGYADEAELPSQQVCTALLRTATERQFTRASQDLQPFGYDLFAGAPSSFAPALDAPVPADYIVGPGDTLRVQLFGKENAEHTLSVGRDGAVNFPGLGPVAVTGQRFEAVQALFERRVAEQMIGVRVSVTMGTLRTIQVFVLGEAWKPGAYTVSALGTITHALYASGGVREIGSLRNIQLKRNGKHIQTLDLYDLLLRGDTRADQRLQPGDVVFVPPVGMTVAVGGQVRRPAVYEVERGATLGSLVELAGGLAPDAYPDAAVLERIVDGRDRSIEELDLRDAAVLARPAVAGDRLEVPGVLDKLEAVVMVSGHVHRPGFVGWREGLRISDVLSGPAQLRSKADPEYVMVRRETGPTRQIEVRSADLAAAWQAPGGPDDLVLEPRDQLIVFDLESDRAPQVVPLLDELQAQARQGAPARVVNISGAVRSPGRYPLEPGMRVSGLLRAAGQLQEYAYTFSAEISRYEIEDGKRRVLRHIPVDLAAVLNGNSALDLELQPYDQVNVAPVANWGEAEIVTLEGEVRFPGRYPIRRGETLDEVIARAGGLSDQAFPAGAVLTRAELQAREQARMDELAVKLKSQLTVLSLEQAQSEQSSGEALQIGQQIAAQIEATKAIGRLVVDLDRVMAGEVKVAARGGDRLIVPRRTQEVTVIGEVQYATSHLHDESLSRDAYVDRSGGFTVKADRSRVYVVRANGQVDVGGRSKRIAPGDTIVVPLDTERMRPLVFWSTISQILYQIALTAASAKTVGAF